MLFRELTGYTLLCLGGASLVLAGGRYALGEWRRDEARQLWEASRASAVVALAHRAVRTESDAVAPGVPMARLLIPRLRLDEIVLEGVDDNALNAGPGHLPGSALPGVQGNSIISAHRDRHFARLGEIQVGDTIMTESDVQMAYWVVTSKRVVSEDAPALFRTRDATLTLTTCWPIRYLGTAPERLIVTAKLVRA